MFATFQQRFHCDGLLYTSSDGCRWRCRLTYTGAHSRSPSFQDIDLENGHVGVGPGICLNQVPDEGLSLLALVLVYILHGLALEVPKLHHQAALVSSSPGFCLHSLLPLILLNFFCHFLTGDYFAPSLWKR